MKKEGKVWIKISGDFATFLKFRSWKRSNIKSKHITSGQIRSNTSKHIPKGEKQLNTKIWKRMMAGLLAGVLIFTGIPFSASAGEPPVQMIIRGDAFQNRQINIFGHSHRSITCYYVNPVEGHVPAFCLQPGKKLPNHTQASWERYSASPETSVPVIGSFDRYLPMTLAYEWMVSGNYYDKTRYAMVQTYFWGCLAGFEQDWDIQEETMKKLEWAIRDGRVLSLFHEMRSVVEKGLEEYESNSGSSLPAWNGHKEI